MVLNNMAAKKRPEQGQQKRYANMKREREISWILNLDEELQATKECWQQETKSSSGMSPLIDYPTPSGHPWNHIYTDITMWIQLAVVMYWCKKGYGFEKEWEGGGSEREKGKNYVIIYQLK